MMRTAVAILAALTAIGAQAQAPSFEVASVKKAPPPGPGQKGMTGCWSSNRETFTCRNATIGTMVVQAYGLKGYQLIGSVAADPDLYNIEARVAGATTQADVMKMLQTLLAERFKLEFHRGRKEVRGYELVVGKDGPKIAPPPPPVDAEQPLSAATQFGHDADGFQTLPANVRPKGIMITRSHGLARIFANSASMEMLTGMLSALLGEPVFDGTGLQGDYKLQVTFTRESVNEPAEDALGGLTVFEAVEKDLGLKLERKSVGVDTLVIDRVDKSAAEN